MTTTETSSQPEEISGDITTLARGAGISLAGRLIGRGLEVVGQIIVARFLGPEVFGLYAVGWTTLDIAGLVVPLGMPQATIRYGAATLHSDPPRFKGVIWQALIASLVTGLVLGVVIALAAPAIAGFANKPALEPVLRLCATGFVILSVLRVASAGTRITSRMEYTIYAEFFAQPITNILFIGLVFALGWGLLGAIGAGVLSYGIALVVALYFLARQFRAVFAKAGAPIWVGREFWVYVLQTAFSGIFSTLILWVDRLAVGLLRPAGEAGIYQSASQVSLLLTTLLAAVTTIFMPLIAALSHRGEMARFAELFRVTTKWVLYLSLPVFLVIAFGTREIILVVFDARYLAATTPILILAAGQLINAGTGPVGVIMLMTGQQKQWFFITGIMLVADLALMAFAVPRWGMIGAAVVTASVITLLFSAGLVQIWRRLRVSPYDMRYRKGIAAALITAAVLALSGLVPIQPDILRLALKVVVAAAVFGGLLIVFRIDAEDRLVLDALWRRVRPSRKT